MDHLRSIATTYYLASSTQTQKDVDDFIKALDKDGNGEVDYFEFKQSLKEQGYKDYANSEFFKKIDKNGDKHLDFSEVMTLYYVIMSGRPFCAGCDEFITAEYFACVECFEKSSAPIYLCPSCYKDSSQKHSHNNKNALFLDTYALLESKRLSALAKKDGPKVEEPVSTAPVTYSPSYYYPPPPSYSPSSSSLAIVPARVNTGRIAFNTFATVVSLANLKVGLLSLGITACTIM